MLNSVLGLCWEGFGNGGTPGMASVRSCWKLPSSLTETMPAGSMMGPQLGKAEPNSSDGGIQELMYLRGGGKNPVWWGEKSENMLWE